MSTLGALKRLGFVMADGRPVATMTSENRRPYEAAGRGRRAVSWYAPGGGPNALLSADQPEIIRRSRAAMRNNGWIKQALKRHVSNEIGTHIRPIFQAPDEDIQQGLADFWSKFVRHADADGICSFYGLLGLAALTRRLSGEAFIRLRPRRSGSGLPVPLQLQILEPEMVPIELHQNLQNGNVIKHGIEFNRRGQRVAYHVYTQHPQDTIFGPADLRTVRIPARLMLHHYAINRPGQIRGEPDTTQCLVDAFDFQEYRQAEAVRKKSKAAMTAMIERPDMQEEADWLYDPVTGALLTDDDSATEIMPGAYNVLMPGESVKFPDGDNTGSGYSDFQRWQLLGMSAGLMIPYQIMTNDLQGINDRLWRAITNEYYRTIDADRENYTVHQICDPVADWFVDTLWLNDLIDLPDYETRRLELNAREWQPQGRRYLNPLQEVQAMTIEKNEGLDSRSGITARLGRRIERIDQEHAADMARQEELGITYGPDPVPVMAPEPVEDPTDTEDTEDTEEGSQ